MSEIEEKAKAQGWNPDFKGEGGKTAEQFVADGEKIAAIQTKMNGKLTDEVSELKADLKNFIDTQHKVTAEARQVGYNKAMNELKAQKLEAVAEADVEKVKTIEKEEDELRKSQIKAQPEPAKIPDDPEFIKWSKDNKWYVKDSTNPESILADAMGFRVEKDRPDLRGQDYYNEVKKRVALAYPEINGKQPVNKLDTSDHSGGGANTGSSYADLPPEAKKACDMQVKKYGIKKEEYVKNYFDMEA